MRISTKILGTGRPSVNVTSLPLLQAAFLSYSNLTVWSLCCTWKLGEVARFAPSIPHAGHTGCDLLATKDFSPTSFMHHYLWGYISPFISPCPCYSLRTVHVFMLMFTIPHGALCKHIYIYITDILIFILTMITFQILSKDILAQRIFLYTVEI